jgi:hypothetical protein
LVRVGTAGDTHQDPRAACPLIETERRSDLLRFGDPLFLQLDVDLPVGIVMSPDDLARAGLGEPGKWWAWR